MTSMSPDVSSMLKNCVMKHFYVALQYPSAPEEEMLRYIGEHLRYMDVNENKIFLSGPLLSEGRVIDDGLTVLRTEDEKEARAFMDAEPLIKAGVRRYDLRLWRVQESSLTVTVSGFHGTGRFG